MFAIAFDMTVAKLKEQYGNPAAAHAEIGSILLAHGFDWAQGSVYITKTDDMNEVFRAIYHLASLEWFRLSVRDIQAFEVKHWSDFTQTVKNFPQSLTSIFMESTREMLNYANKC